MGNGRKVNGDIGRIVRRLSKRYEPDRIILFGSRARGNARRDSDVDLLVIMPVSGSVRRKRVEMRMALHDIPLAKDILLAKPEDVESQKNVPGTLIRYALKEGKTLYARP